MILPIQHFAPLIVSSIKEQLEDYKIHENFDSHQLSDRPAHDHGWWSEWRENPKRVKLEHDPQPDLSLHSEVGMADEELRIPINLDIISGSVHLLDRFEWEISEPQNCPEHFAETYANDLGLSGEFKCVGSCLDHHVFVFSCMLTVSNVSIIKYKNRNRTFNPRADRNLCQVTGVSRTRSGSSCTKR